MNLEASTKSVALYRLWFFFFWIGRLITLFFLFFIFFAIFFKILFYFKTLQYRL